MLLAASWNNSGSTVTGVFRTVTLKILRAFACPAFEIRSAFAVTKEEKKSDDSFRFDYAPSWALAGGKKNRKGCDSN
jgi:hypothetical protein